jgi:TusA-related sulfurtransferase
MKADYRFDTTDTIESFALLKISQQFRNMKFGEILKIQGKNPEMRADILRVLPENSRKIIQEKSGPVWKLWLIKQDKNIKKRKVWKR